MKHVRGRLLGNFLAFPLPLLFFDDDVKSCKDFWGPFLKHKTGWGGYWVFLGLRAFFVGAGEKTK